MSYGSVSLGNSNTDYAIDIVNDTLERLDNVISFERKYFLKYLKMLALQLTHEIFIQFINIFISFNFYIFYIFIILDLLHLFLFLKNMH